MTELVTQADADTRIFQETFNHLRLARGWTPHSVLCALLWRALLTSHSLSPVISVHGRKHASERDAKRPAKLHAPQIQQQGGAQGGRGPRSLPRLILVRRPLASSHCNVFSLCSPQVLEEFPPSFRSRLFRHLYRPVIQQSYLVRTLNGSNGRDPPQKSAACIAPLDTHFWFLSELMLVSFPACSPPPTMTAQLDGVSHLFIDTLACELEIELFMPGSESPNRTCCLVFRGLFERGGKDADPLWLHVSPPPPQA